MDHLNPQKRPVFIVDDEPGYRAIVRACLNGDTFDVMEFDSVDATAAALETHTPGLIFLDLELGDSDAIEALRILDQQNYAGAVQLMSGRGQGALKAVQAAGSRYGFRFLPPLSKPFRIAQVRGAVAQFEALAPAQPRQTSATLVQKSCSGPSFSLGEALDQDWLELWYQPKFDLRTGRIGGAEGLIRARHPTEGIVGPFAFLAGASDEALSRLTERVLLSALQDWDTLDVAGSSPLLSVNVPVSALLNMPIAQIIRENRPKAESWPGLMLEVTEDQILESITEAQEIAAQLQIYGVHLSLDDFGQGYSSLARLRDLPFQELKIDRAFVDGCSAEVLKADLCRTIVEMAHRFGCNVVAEGIEVTADLNVIKAAGCDYGQGYLLGRPMPKFDLLQRLRQSLS